VALIIALLMLATRKDIAYSLVIIWALVGIGENHNGYQTIVTLTEAGAIIIAIALLVIVLVTKLRKK